MRNWDIIYNNYYTLRNGTRNINVLLPHIRLVLWNMDPRLKSITTHPARNRATTPKCHPNIPVLDKLFRRSTLYYCHHRMAVLRRWWIQKCDFGSSKLESSRRIISSKAIIRRKNCNSTIADDDVIHTQNLNGSSGTDVR